MCRHCSRGWGHRHEDDKVLAFLEWTFWWGRQTSNSAEHLGWKGQGMADPIWEAAIRRGQEDLSTEVTLEQGPGRNEAGDVATGDSWRAPQDHVATCCA